MSIVAQLHRLFQQKWFTLVVGGFALSTLMVTLYIVQPPLLRQLDHKMYDMLLPLRQHNPVSPVPIIVDIDEDSLVEYGQWPWPRYLLAQLIDNLKEQGVTAVGMDILFSEADRSSPRQIQTSLKRDTGSTITFSGLPESLYDYDKLFADSLKGSPVVLGGYAQFGKSVSFNHTDKTSEPASVGFVARTQRQAIAFEKRIITAQSATFPLPLLWENAAVGFINMSPDTDGILRQVPLVIQLGTTMFPSLSLRTLMCALGEGTVIARAGADGLESLGIGSYTIPVTPQGNMLVPFQGPGRTYPYISAKDILQKNVPKEALRGKIAFVGTSAAGLLDIRAIPFDALYPGVEVHAAVVDAILTKNFLQEPPWAPGLQVMSIFVCGLIATCVFGFARPAVYAVVGFVMLAVTIYTTRSFFLHNLFISPLYVALTIIVLGSMLLLLRFWQEEQQRLVLKAVFSRYVSPEVVKQILKLRGDVFVGEERELTVMFTDIRGFSTLSEGLNPQQVVLLLNRYFTLMTGLVRQQKGTLDKFIGDALMAFWNAPVEVPEHPVRAVTTALAMQEQLTKLNVSLKEELHITLDMGIGIHTGKAYVGNMGSEELLNYTLIGDAVNLTSRLEGVCSQYGVGIAVSAETARECGDLYSFQHLDRIRVRGKQQPVTVYIPMRKEEWAQRCTEMEEWDAAQKLYLDGNFSEAAQCFESLSQKHPKVRMYFIYAERAQALVVEPPEEWDGIWSLSRKKLS